MEVIGERFVNNRLIPDIQHCTPGTRVVLPAALGAQASAEFRAEPPGNLAVIQPGFLMNFVFSHKYSLISEGFINFQSVLDIEYPNLIDPPSGCSFHPRCAKRQEKCFTVAPELVVKAGKLGKLVECHYPDNF